MIKMVQRMVKVIKKDEKYDKGDKDVKKDRMGWVVCSGVSGGQGADTVLGGEAEGGGGCAQGRREGGVVGDGEWGEGGGGAGWRTPGFE